MKKKKIIFSTSGGTPAMQFMLHILEEFKCDDIGHIARLIAIACNEMNFVVNATNYDNSIELKGTPPTCIRLEGNCIYLMAANIRTDNNTLIFY